MTPVETLDALVRGLDTDRALAIIACVRDDAQAIREQGIFLYHTDADLDFLETVVNR